jgi:para-aminobenzoate synthetase component 1
VSYNVLLWQNSTSKLGILIMNSSDIFTENTVNSGALSPLNSTQLFIRLINLSQSLDSDLVLSNISLLISSSIEPETTTTTTESKNNDRRFSYFSANPSDKRLFYCHKALSTWQQSISFNPAIKKDPEIPFHSGWMGYFAYPEPALINSPVDNAGAGKNLPATAIAEFNHYPWSICFDHLENCFFLLGDPDQAARDAFEWLQSEYLKLSELNNAASINKTAASKTAALFKASTFKPKWHKDDYQKAFFKVQDYLVAGDCYQVNLTHPFISAHYQGSAIDTLQPLFDALKPSFGCYFQGESCELVSMSPERFISIDNTGKLQAKPIKGTIKRSDDKSVDNALIKELTNSAKNQAENLMIVDLLRNDLSISATPGSVKVDKLFELESHPNVHHLVSTISAQLRPEISPAEAISHAFPGGSITGAPKKRAMEIINELEVQPRSLYCGSFGYFSDSGHTDFNILIRSLEFRNGSIICWGGGGITVDSDCDEEYEESLTKIRRIMDVVEGL